MNFTNRMLLTTVVALSTTAALAAENGKIGAWKRTTESHLSDPNGALFKMPPRVAMGIKQQYEGSQTAYYCMDGTAVTGNKILFPPGPCTAGDTTVSGTKLDADYVCTDQSGSGKGHITVTYDSPEHYSGEATFSSASASGLKIKSKIEGQWIAAGCTY
jgi:hypothetical protein